ncbi:MAG: radical SAM protein, partial [Candidatus Helarchaeales archaeon]
RIITECHFCERKCKVNRLNGEKGYCRIGAIPKIYSAHLHFGEEAPLVPSGTIFFMGCTFSCVFCQNFDISSDPDGGVEAPPEKLASLANHLIRNERALNVNYVTPLANVFGILSSMKFQTQNGAQLWNSNHYCSKETMKLIKDIMDFWLPDFKYGNNECAEKYSNAPNYLETVQRNLKMHHEWLEKNGFSQNTIIRHLVMPNHVECCTIPILEWISTNLPGVMVNIMEQYHPSYKVNRTTFPEINRRLTSEELSLARSHATKLGIIWKPVS